MQAIFNFILVIVSTALILLYGIEIIAEIPHWRRSMKLFKLAKKYNLSFIRAKKGWKGGWLSLRAGERNIIEGNINGFPIHFSDMVLVEGTFMLGYDPSIAIQGSRWDLNRGAHSGISRRVSKVNGHFYYMLDMKFINNLFEKIASGQILKEDQLIEILKSRNFSNHVMWNYDVASFVTGIAALILFFLISNLFPIFFSSNEGLSFFIVAIICVPIFVITAVKYGKKFSPDEIHKYPGQDQDEEKIRRKNM